MERPAIARLHRSLRDRYFFTETIAPGGGEDLDPHDLPVVPAVLVLGFWFLVQFLSGLATWAASGPRGEPAGGGTAWFAHLGGFLAGMALLFVLRPRDPWVRGPSRSW